MNSFRPFARAGNTIFKPALHLLDLGVDKKKADASPHRQRHRRQPSASSLDDTDHSDIEHYAAMDGTSSRASHSSRNSRSELQPPVPLIDLSRTPSPFSRTRSATQSDDDDDDLFEPASSIRPLVSHDAGRLGAWRSLWRPGGLGGLGGFFFASWLGWQVWVGLLVLWFGGCSFGLLLMNRFIMLTGVYKFPYPIAGTYLQLLLTHVLLVGFASLTRLLLRPLRRIGFGAAVAPALPAAPPGGFRATQKSAHPVLRFGQWLSTGGTGGIAGGGILEFDRNVAKQVVPLAIVFTAKVLLSNLSFAYAPMSVYQLARIGVVPSALVISAALQGERYSTSTLSSALTATLFLSFASIRSNVRVTWESIVAGVFSSLFVALHPILLLRTYRTLVASLIPQGDVLTGFPSSTDDSADRGETRAYWRTLHYTSLLSLMMLTPVVLLSGEVTNALHNIPFLDVPFFWFMIFCGALGSWAVFVSLLLLLKATSPLTAAFISVPRGAFQLAMLSLFKMPTHTLIGVLLCWLSSFWFLLARREEGRSREKQRLEGR